MRVSEVKKKLEEKLSVFGGERKPMVLESGHFGKGDREEPVKRRKQGAWSNSALRTGKPLGLGLLSCKRGKTNFRFSRMLLGVIPY